MKKTIMIIIVVLVMVVNVVDQCKVETRETFPISDDVRDGTLGIILYAGVSASGDVYVEQWMQEPWVTEATFHEMIIYEGLADAGIVRTPAFYCLKDGTVDCDELLKPYIDDMLNDWVELWIWELDSKFVEQIKAASIYWNAVWG